MTLTQWKSKSLGYILEKIVGGGTPSKANPQYWDGDIPWASVKDLSSTKLDDTADKISEKGLNNSASNLIPAETIVIPTRMALGKVAITTQAMAINQDLKALFPSKEVCKSYLFQWLIFHAEQIASLGSGSTVKGIRLEQLKKIPFSYPTLKEEQQKIAEFLSTVDKKIDLIDQKIAETERLKTGLMQKLFSVGVGVQDENGNWQPHTEFKDSKLGKIPDSWNLGTVKDISPLQGGYAFKSKSATESGVRWLKIANVGKRRVTWDNDSYLPEKFIEEHSDFLLNEGDIVIALTRPVLSGELKVARLSGKDAPALLNQRVARINVNCSVADPGFVYYLFEDKRMANSISKVILGTDPPNISTKQIESFDIAIPPLEEQKSIRKVLSSVSSKIDLLVQQKVETQQLKKGLMQKLLTGEWRVPLEETEAA
ncbi:restriction endonuclease subunit S [Vibrio sp. EA2]|uniref:restriction endonuclease subunit S n=1 Tax=Vibrio sp. EA2 TaxID=3079860 RepID=UPI0029498B77|nr:restriction endonuclease subunit S [Vibrio sp. EA2]MDV6252705.1 restriction endonuclease subunit S [Vibrio sp. EA2]